MLIRPQRAFPSPERFSQISWLDPVAYGCVAGTTVWSIAPKGPHPSARLAFMRTRSVNLMNDVDAWPVAMISTARRSEMQLEPTMAPRVASSIQALRELIQPSSGFEPATSTRIFRIAASDYVTAVLLAPLLKALEEEAPTVRLEISLPTDATARRLAVGDFDLLLTPEEFVDPDHPAELLFEERHVVVGCAHNQLLAGSLTSEAFAAAGHVAVRIDGRGTYVERELDRLGIVRRVEVHVPSFLQTPFLLPGTKRIALMHERLASLMAPLLNLRVIDPPLALPLMREMMQFHAARRSDEGLLWLRSRLKRLASSTD